MKRLAASFAVAALMAAGIVVAQTSPPPTPPSDRSTYPSSSTGATTQSSSATTNTKSHKQAMKDCMDAQKASNPSESKSDMKKYCKGQVESASPHD